MRPQAYQSPEIRDENDKVIKTGAFGKNTPFCTKTNDGILDYILNNLEALHESTKAQTLIDLLYPVGIVVTTATDSAKKPGEKEGLAIWDEIAVDRVLQGTSSGAGGTIDAGLPNITGKVPIRSGYYAPENAWYGLIWNRTNGALRTGTKISDELADTVQHLAHTAPSGYISVDASNSSPVYGKSDTVQPPAYKVHFWRRVK